MAWVAWQDQCRGCEAIDQEQDNVNKKARGVRVFLRRAWTVTRDELARLGG